MPSTLQGEEDLFYLLVLTCCCNKLLDVLYGSSVALIIAPLCVWLLVAARCPWPHYAPHFLHQKDYAHPFRKQFTWRRNVSAFSLLVLRTTLILNLVQILVFGRHMAINMMILNTLIFALGLCGVRLSSAVDTATNPRCSANDHEEPALPKGGEIIPPSPAKTAHAWVVDAGATCHVTGDRELLRDLRPSVLSERLLMLSGLHLPVVGTGSVQTDRITLSNVHYAPGLLVNLISVAQLCREHSLVTIFEPDVLYIKKTASAEIIGLASLDGSGRYVLDYLHLTGYVRANRTCKLLATV